MIESTAKEAIEQAVILCEALIPVIPAKIPIDEVAIMNLNSTFPILTPSACLSAYRFHNDESLNVNAR